MKTVTINGVKYSVLVSCNVIDTCSRCDAKNLCKSGTSGDCEKYLKWCLGLKNGFGYLKYVVSQENEMKTKTIHDVKYSVYKATGHAPSCNLCDAKLDCDENAGPYNQYFDACKGGYLKCIKTVPDDSYDTQPMGTEYHTCDPRELKLHNVKLALDGFYVAQSVQSNIIECVDSYANKVPMNNSQHAKIVLTVTIDYDDLAREDGQRRYEKELGNIIKHVGEVDITIAKSK